MKIRMIPNGYGAKDTNSRRYEEHKTRIVVLQAQCGTTTYQQTMEYLNEQFPGRRIGRGPQN
jgi:hypothetical protein